MHKVLGASLTAIFIFTFNSFANICPQWSAPVEEGVISSKINEASGMSTSTVFNEHFIWSNDSGDDSVVYITDRTGKLQKEIFLSGFGNTDYEALEVSACPNNLNESCLYVADVGNNSRWRLSVKIGVFKEADLINSNSIRPIMVKRFRYPNRQENVEAIIVRQGVVYLFSKEDDGTSDIYTLDMNSQQRKPAYHSTIDLAKLCPGCSHRSLRVTDASFSMKMNKLVVLTYGQVFELEASKVFDQNADSRWIQSQNYQIISIPSDLVQAETITFNHQELGSGFTLSSESEDRATRAPIYNFSCR